MTDASDKTATLLGVIEQFVLSRRGELDEPITLDTPLLESGLVDSFGLIDLGMQISTALDIPLLSGNLLPEDFETPQKLLSRIEEINE